MTLILEKIKLKEISSYRRLKPGSGVGRIISQSPPALHRRSGSLALFPWPPTGASGYGQHSAVRLKENQVSWDIQVSPLRGLSPSSLRSLPHTDEHSLKIESPRDQALGQWKNTERPGTSCSLSWFSPKNRNNV